MVFTRAGSGLSALDVFITYVGVKVRHYFGENFSGAFRFYPPKYQCCVCLVRESTDSGLDG